MLPFSVFSEGRDSGMAVRRSGQAGSPRGLDRRALGDSLIAAAPAPKDPIGRPAGASFPESGKEMAEIPDASLWRRAFSFPDSGKMDRRSRDGWDRRPATDRRLWVALSFAGPPCGRTNP